MTSPQVIAREPRRRVKNLSNKPERRAKQKVAAPLDDDLPAPSQGSAKAGPGAGAGRERSRRVNVTAPTVAGAKALEKSHAAGMLDKGIGKRAAKEAKQRAAGRRSAGALEERPRPLKQPTRKSTKKAVKADGAAKPKRAAAAAEAAPTQKQILRERPHRKRIRRDEGVDAQ